MTPKQVVQFVKNNNIAFIDCRFMDFPGQWQRTTYVASELTEQSFEDGFGFDGSCIRGWQPINEGDMLLMPVAHTARVDPFYTYPTLSMICDVRDPITKKEYARDPRSIARKAAAYLQSTGIADTAYFSPELEFFLFDSVHYDQTINEASYRVDSVEGIWNRGRQDPTNLGNQIRLKEGYFPVPPADTLSNIRAEMVDVMMTMGIPVESHHHEVATGGQGEIDLRHLPLVDMADTCMFYKYVVKNIAARHGKVATFMPKPLFQDNGSGMHTHFSLWKGNKPLFSGRHYANLSKIGLYAIGGILHHARALVAFTNPTTNSFKRLVPGYEAPVNLVYSSRNRSAAIRVPVYKKDPTTKRIEIRFPDPACNPYLAFAAITMAAIDGIRNEIDPGDPIDKDLSELEPEQLEALRCTPVDLDEALDDLERDRAFLMQGDVFSEEVIYYWIKFKREQEINALRQRPHPYEFCMYFDA